MSVTQIPREIVYQLADALSAGPMTWADKGRAITTAERILERFEAETCGQAIDGASIVTLRFPESAS